MSRRNLAIILFSSILIFAIAAAAPAQGAQDPYLSQRTGKAHQQPIVTGQVEQLQIVEIDPYLDQRMGKAHAQVSAAEAQAQKAVPGPDLSVRQKPSVTGEAARPERGEAAIDPYLDQRAGKAHVQPRFH